ncbi:MAG: hypothetical protein AVDCRST_MAG76-2849, partial [uncultured Acidimicrobiales bacterium]
WTWTGSSRGSPRPIWSATRLAACQPRWPGWRRSWESWPKPSAREPEPSRSTSWETSWPGWPPWPTSWTCPCPKPHHATNKAAPAAKPPPAPA